MSRCRYCRELLSEGEECDCPGVQMEAECVLLRQHLDLLTNPIKSRKPKHPVDLEQLIREDREAREARILAYRTEAGEKLRLPLKKPGSLPPPIPLQGEGPTAADQVLQDREDIRQRPTTLEDIRQALGPRTPRPQLRRVPVSPAKRKALLKLDPFDTEVLLRVIRKAEAYEEVIQAVWLQAREACAKLALQLARRRSLAGDEAGADTARQIAKFIREDLSMEEGP